MRKSLAEKQIPKDESDKITQLCTLIINYSVPKVIVKI